MALNIYYEKERHPGRWIFAFTLIALLVGAGWTGYRWYTTGETPFSIPIASANTGIDESEVTKAQISSYNVADNNPRYIRIPSLNMTNTRVYPVKMDASNQIATPTNLNDASWYSKSGTPGSGGVLLMSGHTIGNNRDGAFKQLGTLAVDSQIDIERGDGKVFSYKVVENKSMTVDQVASSGMAAMGKPVTLGSEGLNIIAADGKWVPKLGTYDKRIMLRAALVE
jgi:hypothetical protein